MSGNSKKYTREGLTVHWHPDKCIHSAICAQGLPDVFQPNSKPWIKMENADLEAIRDQVSKCPSGALEFEIAGESHSEKPGESIRIEVMDKGPILVYGQIELTDADGTVSRQKKTTAFCRCGASENKPFCDGAHKKIGFTG